MSDVIYRWIGKTVVYVVARKLRKLLTSEVAVKAGVGTAIGATAITGLAVAAYVATREVPEA